MLKRVGGEKCDLGNCAFPYPSSHPNSSEDVKRYQKHETTSQELHKMTPGRPVALQTEPFEDQLMLKSMLENITISGDF